MKTSSFMTGLVLPVFASMTLASGAFASGSVASNRPHLALKSTDEIRQIFESRARGLNDSIPADQQPVVNAGKRVYEWINLLNKNRAPGLPPLSYSNPSNMSNPSMENPKIYDANTGRDQFNALVAQMPPAYRDIVTGTDPLPTTMPIPEDQFLDWGLRVTNAYDIAVRWMLMEDWLLDLEAEKTNDVRGYVFLRDMKDRDAKLASFATLPSDEQTKLRGWLVDLCVNGQIPSRLDLAGCQAQVAKAEAQRTVPAYYASKTRDAKMLYDSFFTLDPFWIRSDITWSSKEPQTIHYPFLTIADASVAAYFKDNVEDEWKGAGWHLSIDYTDGQRYDLSHLEYQPNTTAHAEMNKIVMDEYEPRTEYLSQWTIRHEFGHLLGFKDCYVEFYDVSINKIVNYPLDPTNLMCSRRGHLQPQHVDVLRAGYYK